MGLYTSIRLLPQIEPYLYDLHLGLSIPILIGPHTNKHIYIYIFEYHRRLQGLVVVLKCEY